MAEPVLQATLRETSGKANAGRLRREGNVPCVLYGVEKESISLAVNQKELVKLLSEAHSVINVKFDDKEQKSVIKEIQYHPVKGDIIHVDLQRIKAGQEIQISVPIKFVGESPGVKVGGVFQTIRTELDISTLPRYLPNEIEIDISAMEMGDTIHIGDLQLENITINHDPDSSVCSIVLPKIARELEALEEAAAAEEEAEEFEEEVAEPEVISSKPEEDEEQEESKE
jgi:large subunit ribosomal protein L25